jgi:hypothetical protein
MELTLALVLDTAGAAVVGGAIAGIVQLIKPLLPAQWSHGRAPMILAATLALLVVVLALVDAQLGLSPGAMFVGLLTWAGVYGAAIGTHATAHKIGTIAAGATNPTGPDAE